MGWIRGRVVGWEEKRLLRVAALRQNDFIKYVFINLNCTSSLIVGVTL